MDKVLINLYVPEIDNSYEIFIPTNKKVGEIIILLNKAINELSNNELIISNSNTLWNKDTNKKYDKNEVLCNTDINNNTNLILLS